MYTVGPTDTGDNFDDWPTSVRQFWQGINKGAYLADFDAGVTLAGEDNDAGTYDNFDVLNAVERSARDDAWDAKVDGYIAYNRPRRGRTVLG